MLGPRGHSVTPQGRKQQSDRTHLSCPCLKGTVARATWEVINKRNTLSFFIFLLALPLSPVCSLLPLLSLTLKSCAAEVLDGRSRGGRAIVSQHFGDTVPSVSNPTPMLARTELFWWEMGRLWAGKSKQLYSVGYQSILSRSCLLSTVVLSVWQIPPGTLLLVMSRS